MGIEIKSSSIKFKNLGVWIIVAVKSWDLMRVCKDYDIYKNNRIILVGHINL